MSSIELPTATDQARWIPAVRICGRSMLPTLAPGQVLVTRLAFGRIRQSDVVVFAAATGRLYVKRIAGMPGDLVTLGAGRLYVKGLPWGSGACTSGAHVERWQVADGHCFVVGDNLQQSNDSRVWSEPFVALDRIRGVGLWRWPWRWWATDTGQSCAQPLMPSGALLHPARTTSAHQPQDVSRKLIQAPAAASAKTV